MRLGGTDVYESRCHPISAMWIRLVTIVAVDIDSLSMSTEGICFVMHAILYSPTSAASLDARSFSLLVSC